MVIVGEKFNNKHLRISENNLSIKHKEKHVQKQKYKI